MHHEGVCTAATVFGFVRPRSLLDFALSPSQQDVVFVTQATQTKKPPCSQILHCLLLPMAWRKKKSLCYRRGRRAMRYSLRVSLKTIPEFCLEWHNLHK